jgi:hypothetical protein
VSPLIALDVEVAFVLAQMAVRRQLCEHGRFHHLLLIYSMCGGMMLPPAEHTPPIEMRTMALNAATLTISRKRDPMIVTTRTICSGT